MSVFKLFYGTFMERIGLKALGNYSASISINEFLISLWENPKNHDFYDFGIFEPITKPHNQLVLSCEAPGYLKQTKKNLGTFEHIFLKLGISEIQMFDNFRKDRRRQMMKIRLIKS